MATRRNSHGLELTKYEALGNDFLVLADAHDGAPYDATFAAAVCDRHRGVGADGLIRLSRAGRPGAVRMELRNADGGPAETSGNGLRCAALAALDEGLVEVREMDIETAAGVSRAVVGRSRSDGSAEVSVTMGELVLEEIDSPLEARRAFRVDAGNPHLVVLGDSFADVDLAVLGPVLEASEPAGLNVELVSPSTTSAEARGVGDVQLEMLVWERGVGLTLACGSGSVASAAAARLAGLGGGSGARIAVVNPGGTLLVDLSGDDPRRPWATLTGRARRVAAVTVRPEHLLAAVGATV